MLALANREWMIDHQLLKSIIKKNENIQSLTKSVKLQLKSLEELFRTQDLGCLKHQKVWHQIGQY